MSHLPTERTVVVCYSISHFPVMQYGRNGLGPLSDFYQNCRGLFFKSLCPIGPTGLIGIFLFHSKDTDLGDLVITDSLELRVMPMKPSI